MKRSPAADMTTGNVTRHILRFALPLLVGNIFQQFYNAADSIIVGRFVGKQALAALGVAAPVMNIVLFNPEIPQNTGNIARTCAATGATLHLIEPLGFSLSDKYLKRAGLDYWNLMTYHTYPDFGEFLRQHPDARMHFASTKAPRGYHEATYQDGDFLIFGCETRGLPENLLEQVYDRCIRIPMRPEARSLNLSNSVAIVLYEALRQTDFPGLSSQGHLTGRDEEPAPWLDYV